MRLQSDEKIMRLRQRLYEMTEGGHQPNEHIAILAEISSELPNTIRVIETKRDPESFTCGMYAFGLFEDVPKYKAVAEHRLPGIHAGLKFLDWLAASRLVEIVKPSENDLVMYFDDGGSAHHVGRVGLTGRVISKWGCGLLYDHGLSEVPKSYGDEVRLFRSIDPDMALEHFLDYAKEKGAFED